MISLRRPLILSLMLMVVPLSTIAQSSSETKIINTILAHIPVQEQLEESPRDLHQQFSQNPFGLPASQNEQMMKTFLETFTADTLSDHIRQIFQEHFDKTNAQSASDWLTQEKNRPLLAAEKEYYTIDGIRKRVVNRYEMEQQSPSEQRKKLIENLAQSKSAAETEIETQVILFRSLVKAFGILSPQRSLSEAQIEGFVNNFRNRAQMQIRSETNQKLMIQFHGIDNELIRDYQSFYESEAGRWLNQTTAKALKSAYQKASDEFLQSIKNL